MNNFKISVIICAYTINRYQDTIEAVESVLNQTLKPHEIILSIDHNQELLERFQEVFDSSKPDSQYNAPHIKMVLNKGVQGLSETRNVGIRASCGDIIAFIDDDATAQEDWLEKLVIPFKDSKVIAVGGHAIPVWPGGKRPVWFPEEIGWIVGCTWTGLQINGGQIRNVPGCNMAFRQVVFDKVGYWSLEIGACGQKLKDGEEAEFCLRITSTIKDALILYSGNAIINHKVPVDRASIKWVIKRSFMQGQSKGIMKSLSVNQQVLSVESSYLRFLLLKAIPNRLKCFYKNNNLFKSSVIMLSIVVVGMGYARSRISRLQVRKSPQLSAEHYEKQ